MRPMTLKSDPDHPDMNTNGMPTWIWEVNVDNRLFVRAYSGTSSRWYQAYLKKYFGSCYVSVMTGTRARAATIEILPS